MRGTLDWGPEERQVDDKAGRNMWQKGEAAGQRTWHMGHSLVSLHQRYTYKYEDQPQQTFSIQKANYIAANGVFHTVTPLRWQLPPPLPGDPKVSYKPLLHLVL